MLVSLRSPILRPLAVAFATAFVLTYVSPLSDDDFDYGCCLAKPLTGGERVQAALRLYWTWNPRIGSLMAYFFVGHSAILFAFLNATFFSLLVWSVFYHSQGRRPTSILGDERLLWLIFLGLIAFCNRWLNEVFFMWRTGSVAYLWAGTVLFLFLIPYRRLWRGSMCRAPVGLAMVASPLFFLVGILAGMSDYGTIAILPFFLVFFVLRSMCPRIRPMALGYFAGVAGFIIGVALMYISTGSFYRLKMACQKISDANCDYTISARALKMINDLAVAPPEWLLLGSLTLLLLLLARSFGAVHKHKAEFSLGFFLLACLQISALVIGSPHSPWGRPSFVAFVFMVMAFFSLYPLVISKSRLVTFLFSLAVIPTGLLKIYMNFEDARQSLKEQREVDAYVIEQIKGGISDVILPYRLARSKDKFYARAALDFSYDASFGLNRKYAGYMGIRSIRLEEPPAPSEADIAPYRFWNPHSLLRSIFSDENFRRLNLVLNGDMISSDDTIVVAMRSRKISKRPPTHKIILARTVYPLQDALFHLLRRIFPKQSRFPDLRRSGFNFAVCRALSFSKEKQELVLTSDGLQVLSFHPSTIKELYVALQPKGQGCYSRVFVLGPDFWKLLKEQSG